MHMCARSTRAHGFDLRVVPAATRIGVRIGPQGKQAASPDGAADCNASRLAAAAPVPACALEVAPRAGKAALLFDALAPAPLPSTVAISSAWSTGPSSIERQRTHTHQEHA